VKKILVIDDDEGVRKVMSLHLNGSEYDVTTTGSYDEGLAIAVTGGYHLIFCDLKIADRSGLELIKILRETGKTAPIIAISGFIDSMKIEDALLAGASAYLSKPFTKSELLKTLADVAWKGGS
jgi:CheY-like chemotaxis protein